MVKLITTITIIVAIIGTAVLFSPVITKKMHPIEFEELVVKYSEEHGVDRNLVFAIIKMESNFKTNATSHKDAKGLMQLMPATAKEMSKKLEITIADDNFEEWLSNPETNINMGTKYIAFLIEKYGNVGIALAAYNAGIGTVDNWLEKGVISSDGSDLQNIPYKETNLYVRKVLRACKIYEKLK